MNIIQKMRKITGLSQSRFARLFNIPTRTLQRWEIHQAEPTKYLQGMMLKLLILEDNGFDKEALKELKQRYDTQ